MKADDLRQADTRADEKVRNAGRDALGAETDVTTRLRTKAEWAQESGLIEAVCERGNPILNYEESLLIFNHVAASIRFIKALELKIKQKAEAAKKASWEDDEVPF